MGNFGDPVGTPRDNAIAYHMISMAGILTELAKFGEKHVIVPDAKTIEDIKTVLNLFDITYHIKQVGEKELFITMKDSLWGK